MADNPNYSHGEFCWYEIASRDPGAAKDFYSQLLGYSMEDSPMPGGGGTYTMVRNEGGDVGGLYELAGEMFEGVPSHWMPYVWVDDVDAAAEKAKQLGGQVMAEPMDIPDVGQMAVIQDPTGAAISVFHGSGHQGAARPGAAEGAVGWNELMTRDTAAARDFYTQLFGWDPQETPMEHTTYTVFNKNGQSAAGMMGMVGQMWEGIPPHWMPYVSVHNCQATADKVASLGGTIEVPPTEVPNVGTFSVIRDPAGAVVSIMEFLPQE